MPTVTQVFNFGADFAGQAVEAQAVDTLGVPLAPYSAAGFIEMGAGQYLGVFTLPYGFTGALRARLVANPTVIDSYAVSTASGRPPPSGSAGGGGTAQFGLSGAYIAGLQKQVRRAMGPGAFAYAGKFYDCTSKSLDGDAGGGLLLEGGANTDSVDQRRISLSPADFTTGAVYAPPAEGAACTYQGGSYLIKKALACELAFGVPVALPVVIFRTPPPDAATTETAAEATAASRPQDTGKRRDYLPPDSPI